VKNKYEKSIHNKKKHKDKNRKSIRITIEKSRDKNRKSIRITIKKA